MLPEYRYYFLTLGL